MRKSTVYTRTLALAAESLGGVQPLANRLKAEPAALRRWIAGEEFPPHEAFLQALDIVAAGPRADPAARPPAGRTQAHADRLQAAANRVRESAQRLQVHPKDGAPASNKPGGDEKNKAKG